MTGHTYISTTPLNSAQGRAARRLAVRLMFPGMRRILPSLWGVFLGLSLLIVGGIFLGTVTGVMGLPLEKFLAMWPLLALVIFLPLQILYLRRMAQLRGSQRWVQNRTTRVGPDGVVSENEQSNVSLGWSVIDAVGCNASVIVVTYSNMFVTIQKCDLGSQAEQACADMRRWQQAAQ